jgi:hypothetical protein
MPKRIQLRRTKGWRKPEGAVVVARPGIWGNPFVVRPDGPEVWTVEGVVEHVSRGTATGCAVQAYRHALVRGELDVTVGHARDVLAGRDLACWCRLDQPCHADVLLELVNGETA